MKPYYPRKHKTIIERFESHILIKDGCWIWRNPNKGTGYGEFEWNRVRYIAHRFSYEHFNSTTIPDGLQIDHKCRNRACVNPDHLRILSLAENVLCGIGITAKNKVKTHCLNGHEFTENNTYYFHGHHRSCKICRDKNSRKSSLKLKASSAPCVICGNDFVWSGGRKKVTCSQSCAVKLSHQTSPRNPPKIERAKCSICGEPSNAKNLCGKHYSQSRRKVA